MESIKQCIITDTENVQEDSWAMTTLKKIFGRKMNRTDKFFNKIRSNFVFYELFTFLTLSNARSLIFVNKKFKGIFESNNRKVLKLIGNNTYGINQRIDFLNDPSGGYIFKAIKSSFYPIMKFEFAENLDLLITSPGEYHDEIKVWSFSKRIYFGEIVPYKSEDQNENTRSFISSFAYMSKSFLLVVGYSTGWLVSYDMRQKSLNKSRFDKIDWIVKFAKEDQDLLKSIVYNKIDNQIITVETNSFLVNFIKVFCNKGNLIKVSIYLNEIITFSDIFYNSYEDISSMKNNFDVYYCFGTDNGVVNMIKYGLLESNFSNLSSISSFKGPTTDIERILYIKEKEENPLLVVSYKYVGLYIWDIENYMSSDKNLSLVDTKNKINVAVLIRKYQWETHLDKITGMCYLGNKVFATSSEDRAVIIWDYTFDGIQTSSSDIEEKSQCIIQTIKQDSGIYHLYYNSSENELLTTSYDCCIRIHKISQDFKTLISTENMNGHKSVIKSWQIDYLSKTLITASVDKVVKIWDFNDISLLNTIDMGKEILDGFIIIKDHSQTIIKIDLTKKIKLMRPEISNKSKYLVYNTIEDVRAIRCILNLMDGITFAVGYSAPFIGIYNYYTEDTSKSQCVKILELEHSPTNLNKFYIGDAKIEVKEPKPYSTAKITKLQFVYFKKKRFIVSGASNGTACIFNIQGHEKFAYTELSDKNNIDIIDICPLIAKENSFTLGFLLSNGELYIQDFLTDTFAKKFYSIFNISAIDRLNDTVFAVGYSEEKKIDIVDLNGNSYQTLKSSYKGIRNLIYMNDGKQILAYCGNSIVGFSLDLFSFIY